MWEILQKKMYETRITDTYGTLVLFLPVASADIKLHSLRQGNFYTLSPAADWTIATACCWC